MSNLYTLEALALSQENMVDKWSGEAAVTQTSLITSPLKVCGTGMLHLGKMGVLLYSAALKKIQRYFLAAEGKIS